MKKEIISKLFEKFEKACIHEDEVECWSARELQEILAYTQWRNFLKVIDKAKIACENANISVNENFLETKRLVELGKGSQRELVDMALSRYACYLIAQNGDSAKVEIAFAQTYFAVQTRKQEIIEKRLLDLDRLSARDKLSKSEKKLSGIIYERGVDEKGFGIIRSKGDQALFGGFSTSEMKRRLTVPDSRPIADFLPSLTIKAKDFATELTSHNVLDKDLASEARISTEHVDNNKAVRKILIERGVKPENLPPAEDVKKVRRKLEKEEKVFLEDMKKS